MQLERRGKRKNGFQAPYSREQLLSLSVYLISVFLNFLFIIFEADGPLLLEILVIDSLLTSLTITCWLFASIIDPAVVGDDKTSVDRCFPVQRSSVFCLDCEKTIYRMDHHCSFLNNCVGGKNYGWFCGLVLFGMLQMTLQLIVVTLCFLTHQIHHWHEAR